jgi:hypothetical protein
VLGVEPEEVCYINDMLQLCNAQARAAQGLIVEDVVSTNGNGDSGVTGMASSTSDMVAGAGIGASAVGVAAVGFFVMNKRKNANTVDMAVAQTEAAMAQQQPGKYAIQL